MMDRVHLLEALNDLEATISKSFELGNEEFKSNRKQAIQLRRTISEKVASISRIGDIVFEGSPLHSAFRSEFAMMRSTMAMHQASWPVVAIDLHSADYLKSAAKLRESNARFMTWLRVAVSRAE